MITKPSKCGPVRRLTSIPRIHIVKRNNWLPQDVLLHKHKIKVEKKKKKTKFKMLCKHQSAKNSKKDEDNFTGSI